MKHSLTLSTLLIAVPLLLGVPTPWGALDLGVAPVYGQTIGEGVFEGGGDQIQEIHNSDPSKSLCLKLTGQRGTASALFDTIPVLTVASGETNSACRDDVMTVELQCIGAKCGVDWRLVALALQGPQGPEGPGGADGSDGADGLPGNFALAGMACSPGSFVTGFDESGDLICSSISAPVCGNGVVEFGEQCDDGNTTAGDGCSFSCQLEGAACGNGTLDPGEACDDGNILAGDGCSPSCQLETPLLCGNGTIDPGEACDDGNVAAGDGCSSSCQLEGPCPGGLPLITHDNGQGQTWQDCVPLGTYNGTQASNACAAYTGNLGSCFDFDCADPGNFDNVVCGLLGADCACWTYAGALTTGLTVNDPSSNACTCPAVGDNTWN